MSHGQEADEKQLKVLRIVWAATGSSIFFYGIVLKFVNQNQEVLPLDPLMQNVLTGVASLAFLGSIYLPRYLFSSQKKASSEQEPQVMDYAVPFKMQLAINDSIAIFGLALAFISHHPTVHYPFFAVALLHHLYRYPASKQRLKQFYQRNNY